MMRRTREKAEQTRLALLESAVRLFAAKGVTVTTLNEIASDAGVTRGAIYWHFNDKGDIIRAIWQTYASPRLLPLLERIGQLSPENPVQDFEEIVRDMLALVVGDADVGLAVRILLHNVETIDCNIQIRHFFVEIRENFLLALTQAFSVIKARGALRQAIAPEFAARGFLIFFTGLLEQHFLKSGGLSLQEHAPAFIDAYLYGVLSEG
ncbi:MAG: hypothetical protein A2018_06695 [Alphaproteobacteria bacterium GWF2_58_20]|nr:MAG: hypothetical protein A2018_06695 [Alphaproteobacteria bacterium GWF2_58_20]